MTTASSMKERPTPLVITRSFSPTPEY